MNNLRGDPTRDHATYNWTCEKHDSLKLRPQYWNVWHCALLIVILSDNLIVNCKRLKLKGNPVDVKGIHSINNVSPFSFSDIILPSMTLFLSYLMHSFAPLRNCSEFRFRSKVIWETAFNLRQCHGIPGMFNEFENPVEKLTFSPLSIIVTIDI